MTYPDVDQESEDIDFDNLVTTIHFSKESLPSIEIPKCVGGILQNLGDLNNDGKDEIGLWRGWISSSWQTYLSWKFTGESWTPLTKDFTIHCSLWDTYGENFKPIKRIDGQRIKIYYSEWKNNGIATSTKVIRLK